MAIPKYLLWEGMSADDKKHLETFVESKLKKMRSAPTFPTAEAAKKKAVEDSKRNDLTFPSVWKEPADVGNKYIVVHTESREDAYTAGYTEVIDEQKIFDAAKGVRKSDIDHIEEV